MADENNIPRRQGGLQSLLDQHAAGLDYLRQSPSFQKEFFPTKEEMETRTALLSDFLGSPDYAAQLQESKELAKMQLGLALAQRGFAAMGAQPGYGESPVGVLGRTLAAPLAGDVSTVAGQLMQQRQAAKQAEEQLGRQTKLAALEQLTEEGKQRREYLDKRLEELGDRGFKPIGKTTVSFTREVNGNPVITEAMLVESPDGAFRYVSADGEMLNMTGRIWRTTEQDQTIIRLANAWQEEFSESIGDKHPPQWLTSNEKAMLAGKPENEREEIIKNLANDRISLLEGREQAQSQSQATPTDVVSPTTPTDVVSPPTPTDVVSPTPPTPDEQNRILTSSGKSGGPPVVDAGIIDPWSTVGGVQLGRGTHLGFDKSVSAKEIPVFQQNAAKIKETWQRYFPAEPLGDTGERVLLFSGLWKSLPGMSEKLEDAGLESRSVLNTKDFKEAYTKKLKQYNEAVQQYKPADEIMIDTKRNISGQTAIDQNIQALHDNLIMLRYKDVGGAWYFDGGWLADLRQTAFGELFEDFYYGEDDQGKEIIIKDMPTKMWSRLVKPDAELSADEKKLKETVFDIMKNHAKFYDQKRDFDVNDFQAAAEYLAAVDRYKVRAFEMIRDSRPSDKDIAILLAVFADQRKPETRAFIDLANLQKQHIDYINQSVRSTLEKQGVFSPETVVRLGHLSRALKRSSLRDLDFSVGGKAQQTKSILQDSASKILNSRNNLLGRVYPGFRAGAVSPLTKTPDINSTRNLYNLLVAAATREYGDRMPELDRAKKFIDDGLHLISFPGTYGIRKQRVSPVVESRGPTGRRRFTVPTEGTGK